MWEGAYIKGRYVPRFLADAIVTPKRNDKEKLKARQLLELSRSQCRSTLDDLLNAQARNFRWVREVSGHRKGELPPAEANRQSGTP